MGGPVPVVMSLHGKGGGARGSLPAFARARNLEAAVYVHPAETGHGLAEVKHVSRGVIDLTLTVEGWQGPQREIGTPDSARFAEGGDALEASAALVGRAREVLGDSDLNVGRVTAGKRPGAVPDRCETEFRILFSGARTVDGILGLLNRALAGEIAAVARPEGRFRFSLEALGTRANPVAVPWDEPLCRVLRAVVTAVTGAEPISYGGHLASDIRFPVRLLGIPAVGIGSRGGNFYGPDEWVDMDDLVRLVAVIMLTAWSWHGSGGSRSRLAHVQRPTT
jgi:acetylornithine deacetylase